MPPVVETSMYSFKVRVVNMVDDGGTGSSNSLGGVLSSASSEGDFEDLELVGDTILLLDSHTHYDISPYQLLR